MFSICNTAGLSPLWAVKCGGVCGLGLLSKLSSKNMSKKEVTVNVPLPLSKAVAWPVETRLGSKNSAQLAGKLKPPGISDSAFKEINVKLSVTPDAKVFRPGFVSEESTLSVKKLKLLMVELN